MSVDNRQPTTDVVYDPPEDGSCQFLQVCATILGNLEYDDPQETMRYEIVEYLTHHPLDGNAFSPLETLTEFSTREEYLIYLA